MYLYCDFTFVSGLFSSIWVVLSNFQECCPLTMCHRGGPMVYKIGHSFITAGYNPSDKGRQLAVPTKYNIQLDLGQDVNECLVF